MANYLPRVTRPGPLRLLASGIIGDPTFRAHSSDRLLAHVVEFLDVEKHDL